MKVKMWGGRVPCVSQFSQNRAFLCLIAGTHLDGIFLQMRIEGETSPAEIEHDMVAIHGLDGNKARFWQSTRNLVVEIVQHANDFGIGHCEHVRSVVVVIVDVAFLAVDKTPLFV